MQVRALMIMMVDCKTPSLYPHYVHENLRIPKVNFTHNTARYLGTYLLPISYLQVNTMKIFSMVAMVATN